MTLLKSIETNSTAVSSALSDKPSVLATAVTSCIAIFLFLVSIVSMLHREPPSLPSPPLAKWLRALIRVAVGGVLIGVSVVLPNVLAVMAISSVVLWGLLVLDVYCRVASVVPKADAESEALMVH